MVQLCFQGAAGKVGILLAIMAALPRWSSTPRRDQVWLIASSSSWLRILPRGSEFFLVAHISSSLLNRNFPHHCVKFFLTVRTLPHKQNYSSQIELFLTVRTLPHKQNSSSQAEFFLTGRILPHKQNSSSQANFFLVSTVIFR